jgi:DNA-binding transcriptional regulator YhcF (GntR family)
MTPEQLLTPRQVAEILQVSVDTVNRKFQNIDGVLNMGSGETFSKRRYTQLRIPRAVLNRFLESCKVSTTVRSRTEHQTPVSLDMGQVKAALNQMSKL